MCIYIKPKKNEEICGPNSFHKIGLQKRDAHSFINMPNVLSTSNVRLFFNTLSHVHASIFFNPCHGVSSAGYIRSVIGSDTMLNYQLSKKLKLIGRGKFNRKDYIKNSNRDYVSS